MHSDDPFGRIDYRRFVSWENRIRREMPFLLHLFGDGSKGARLLDVGCGTGEHARALSERGFRVIGLDRSTGMLDKARGAYPEIPFVRGSMDRLPVRGGGILGGAYCLGNTLVNLAEDDGYQRLFRDLRDLLRPGAPLLIQILNYRRILEKEVRHLPLNFRRTDSGNEILFLRVMDRIDERRIRFEVLTLQRKPPSGETRLVRTQSSILRPLREEELERFLRDAGFEKIKRFGDYRGSPFVPDSSQDLIVVAR
ncbi:MAG: class I SAM-dependent methyltransferase [Candidatus Eisenbacteria bacterium]|nr:class I SAM-dependent methyltransferase [Candidatus Eisenbacteria bacterium]